MSKYGNHFNPATEEAIEALINGDDPKLGVLTVIELQNVEQFTDRVYGRALMNGALGAESFMLERSVIINSNVEEIRKARGLVDLVVAELIRRNPADYEVSE